MKRREFIKTLGVAALSAGPLIQAACTTSPSTASSTDLRVLFQTGGDAIGPKKGLADFLAQHKGWNITQEEVPPESLYQRLVTNFTSPKAIYDVVEFYPTWLGDFVEAKYLTNLDSYFQKYASEINVSDYLETGSQNNRDKYGGNWYGVPYDNDLMVFYYRQDFFNDATHQAAFSQKYGYKLDVPQTWDQVLDIARYFKSTGKISGFSTVASRTWWAVGYWYNVYGSYGGKLQVGNKVNLDHDAFITANDMWMKLLETAPQGVTGFGYTESRAAIIEGKSVQSLQWATTAITGSVSPGVSLGVALMPGVKQTDGTIFRTPALPVGKVLAIPANAQHKDEAFQYAMYLSSPKMQKIETLADSGIDPNRKSVFEDPEVKKAWETMIPVVEKTLPIGVPDLNVKNSNQYYETLIAELTGVWTKQQTAEQAYGRILAGWKQIG